MRFQSGERDVMTKRYKNKAHRAMNDMNWDWSDDGYEYSEPNKKLRRNKIDGSIGGVCAGLGDYFGLDHTIVRIAAVISLFMTAGNSFWVYLGFWMFVPSDKRAPYHREYREVRKARRERKQRTGRDYDEAPVTHTSSFKDVKSKFRSLETRLQDLERSITSKEWKLRRDFRDLEG